MRASQDTMRNAVSDGPGFASARSRQDHDGPLKRLGDCPLLSIKALENRFHRLMLACPPDLIDPLSTASVREYLYGDDADADQAVKDGKPKLHPASQSRGTPGECAPHEQTHYAQNLTPGHRNSG